MIEVQAIGPVPEHDLARAEARLGIRLPVEYRRWLAQTGGGVTVENIVIPGSDDLGAFGRFLGIGGDPGFDLTKMQRTGFAEVVPVEYLVIAYGHGGSVCLRVADGEEGSVWWADYVLSLQIAPAGGPTPEIMRRLASTFDDFLVSLP